MKEHLELVIGNTLEEIPRANERVGEWLGCRGVPTRAVLFANLCVEEIVSNCVKYGYDDSARHEIFIRIEADTAEMLVEIRDDGREFDPLNAPEPDLTIPLDQRPIGGMGLLMLRQMADRAEYHREGGVNRLELWKSLS